uniref:Uncharacterized protein n=1 Tax=candidate division WOR-3 bacterium TaxID=2052148 RepID=A0A7C4TAX5_UNCW3
MSAIFYSFLEHNHQGLKPLKPYGQGQVLSLQFGLTALVRSSHHKWCHFNVFVGTTFMVVRFFSLMRNFIIKYTALTAG